MKTQAERILFGRGSSEMNGQIKLIEVIEKHGKITNPRELYELYKNELKTFFIDKKNISVMFAWLVRKGQLTRIKKPGFQRLHLYGLYSWFHNGQPKEEYL